MLVAALYRMRGLPHLPSSPDVNGLLLIVITRDSLAFNGAIAGMNSWEGSLDPIRLLQYIWRTDERRLSETNDRQNLIFVRAVETSGYILLRVVLFYIVGTVDEKSFIAITRDLVYGISANTARFQVGKKLQFFVQTQLLIQQKNQLFKTACAHNASQFCVVLLSVARIQLLILMYRHSRGIESAKFHHLFDELDLMKTERSFWQLGLFPGAVRCY